VPLLALLLAPPVGRIAAIGASALALLGLLGALGGRLGGAAAGRAAVRATVGGGLAMAATALIGRLAGAASL
jgi:vacuolar iron transporter family protein